METAKNLWPHAPARVGLPAGAIMLTSAAFRKQPLFQGDQRLSLLQDRILFYRSDLGWQLEAWAAFPNHDHLMIAAPEKPSLSADIGTR